MWKWALVGLRADHTADGTCWKKATTIRHPNPWWMNPWQLLQGLIQLQMQLLEIRKTLFRTWSGISKIVGLRDEASVSFKEYLGAHIQSSGRLCCASTDWKDCFKSRCEIYAENAKGNVLIDFHSFFFFFPSMLYIGWGFYTKLNQKEVCGNRHKERHGPKNQLCTSTAEGDFSTRPDWL